MKNLIIYYSRKGENYFDGAINSIDKGNTEYVAEFIKEAVGGDLFEVETVKEYPKSYIECIEVAKQEMNNDEKPELKKYLDDISEYDNVFVCGPCWWGTYPCAIFSLLERLDFTNKNVFPVMTHEGSGLAGSKQSLIKYCKGANVKDGLAIKGSKCPNSKELVSNWAKGVVE